MKALVALAFLSFSLPSFAADVSITNGDVGSASKSGRFSIFGSNPSDWTKAPSPYQGNTNNHKGRSAGNFEDHGNGGVKLRVRSNSKGEATVKLQDVADTENGRLSVKVGGQWHKLNANRGDNGNIRTITIKDLPKDRWAGLKIAYHKIVSRSGKGPNGRQDGFAVCK